MNFSKVMITIEGLSPYSQSRGHDEPRLEGESVGDWDTRTWRSKLSVANRNGTSTVVIPAHGFHQSMVAAAKYSKRQIPGQGKATWTAKFTSGISLVENPALGINPYDVQAITISANADGVRGSGKRVMRKFPIMNEWSSTFEVWILDPIITEQIFMEIAEIAGLFIGIGRFRPEKGGTNGRFQVTKIVWEDNRKMVA